jgi:hypothetical protein
MVLGVEDPSGSAGIGCRKGHSVVHRCPDLHPHLPVSQLCVPSDPNHLESLEALLMQSRHARGGVECKIPNAAP